MKIEDDIKPCPFCGSKDIDCFDTDFGVADNPFVYIVQCENCNANIYAKSRALEDAIELWNKRK